MSLPPNTPTLPCFALNKPLKPGTSPRFATRGMSALQIGAAVVVLVVRVIVSSFFLFFPRGTVSNDWHKNREDKEKSQSCIRSSESPVYWLLATAIYRSPLLKIMKNSYLLYD